MHMSSRITSAQILKNAFVILKNFGTNVDCLVNVSDKLKSAWFLTPVFAESDLMFKNHLIFSMCCRDLNYNSLVDFPVAVKALTNLKELWVPSVYCDHCVTSCCPVAITHPDALFQGISQQQHPVHSRAGLCWESFIADNVGLPVPAVTNVMSVSNHVWRLHLLNDTLDPHSPVLRFCPVINRNQKLRCELRCDAYISRS